MNFFREISNWLLHRRLHLRRQDNTGVIDDHDLRADYCDSIDSSLFCDAPDDEESIRIEPHIDYLQKNVGGTYSLSIDIQTANACYICYQQFDDQVREFRANRDSHWCEFHCLSDDNESLQDVTRALIFFNDKEKLKQICSSLRRYCTECMSKTITFHLSKASSWTVSYSYGRESPVQAVVKFSCPLCFQPCSDFSPVRAALNVCCDKNHHCANRIEYHKEIYKEMCSDAKRICNIWNRYQMQMPHWFSCHVSGCNYAAQANVKRKSIVCPEHGEMCVICLERAHLRKKCSVKGFMTNSKNTKLRRCSGCLMIIEKNGGCDWMTCICGNQFSWLHQARSIKGDLIKRK